MTEDIGSERGPHPVDTRDSAHHLPGKAHCKIVGRLCDLAGAFGLCKRIQRTHTCENERDAISTDLSPSFYHRPLFICLSLRLYFVLFVYMVFKTWTPSRSASSSRPVSSFERNRNTVCVEGIYDPILESCELLAYSSSALEFERRRSSHCRGFRGLLRLVGANDEGRLDVCVYTSRSHWYD